MHDSGSDKNRQLCKCLALITTGVFVSFRKIILGTAAMSSASALRLLAQFLIIPILSRLLSPSDYGLVAIAMPLVLFTMMFTDAGVGRSLVRDASAEKEVWSTCFWLSVILGLLLAIAVIALAPLAALVFKEPRLSPILMTLSLVIFIQALSTIPGALLQKKYKFKAIASIEIISLCIGLATALVIALSGGGAWALIGQQIAFYLVRVILTFWFSPFYPLMIFDLKIAREHLLFGRDVIGVTLINLIARSADNLIIGKMFGSALVGIYSMAFQFARLPVMLVAGPLQYVIYAQLAPLKTNPLAIRHIYLLLNRVLAIIVFPVMAMVAVAHEPIFKLVLSEKWEHSGELFMMAAAACALQTVTGMGSTIMMLLGRNDRQLRASAEFTMLWIVCLLAVARLGLEWTTIMYSVVVFLYTPRLLMLLLPLIQCSIKVYIRTLLTPAVLSLVCVGVYVLANDIWVFGEGAQVVTSALLALASMGASVLAQGRLLKEEGALCKQLLHTEMLPISELPNKIKADQY